MPSTTEITMYILMAEMHVPPSELGINMNDMKNINRFSRVHRFIKTQESLSMQPKKEDTNPNHYTRTEEELKEMFK